MICKVASADICGLDVFEICVEADVSGGLPGFYMVGLPSSEVKEARERVERAVINSGFDFPARKITINLSPAYLRKQGSGLDLPIAAAVLAAFGTIDPETLDGTVFIGELSLDGSVNKIKGVLPVAVFAKERGFKRIVVPEKNAFEGAAVGGIVVQGVSSLKQLVYELNRRIVRDVSHINLEEAINCARDESELDFGDVIGQESAKRATLAAVSGFHNLLYIGPPGSGKSMMAQRIPTVFNKMSEDECLEVSKIYSVAGLLEDNKPILKRPFRAPNQSITDAALLGGSNYPKPGEITLAHRGVLFLDELAEFKKKTIDKLRGPLEARSIDINRIGGGARFPCDFMLVGATNPCKCGYYPDRRYCRCSEREVAGYLGKIRGPILDRIDICVGISKVNADLLAESTAFTGESSPSKGGSSPLNTGDFPSKSSGMTSADMRELAKKAASAQRKRFEGSGIHFNSQMSRRLADEFCVLERDASLTLKKAYEKYNMTARGWYKILKVSRTLADIDGAENIAKKHILEAIGYRNTFLSD